MMIVKGMKMMKKKMKRTNLMMKMESSRRRFSEKMSLKSTHIGRRI